MNICTINCQKSFFVKSKYRKIIEKKLGFNHSTFGEGLRERKDTSRFQFKYSDNVLLLDPPPKEDISTWLWQCFYGLFKMNDSLLLVLIHK